MDVKKIVSRFRALDVRRIKNPEMREKARKLKGKQGGFTLLELLVVIAIMATLAGSLLVSYDGLQGKADKAQATFNLAAIDKGLRTFKVVTGGFPDKLDNLIDDTAGAGLPLFSLPEKLQGKLANHVLTADGVSALSNVGIETVRVIPNADNNAAGVGAAEIPNRVFDEADRGLGVDLPLAVGERVAIIEADQIDDLLGDANTDSSRLRDIAGLDSTIPHLVVALGVGNNSTIVSSDSGANAANFSQAPFYGSVDQDEYGRFVALFHIASDDGAGGNTADDAVFDSDEYFEEAKFIGVVDTFGDWLDEELAEFTGQKS